MYNPFGVDIFLFIFSIIISNHSIIQASNHSITQSSNHSIIQSFNHTIIQSFNHTIINHSIIQSFKHPIIQSFKHTINYLLNTSAAAPSTAAFFPDIAEGRSFTVPLKLFKRNSSRYFFVGLKI